MPTAIYHQSAPHGIEMTVAKDNKDGTVHLADDKGKVRIHNCRVATEPTTGCCVLVPDKTAAEKAAAEKAAAEKAAANK